MWRADDSTEGPFDFTNRPPVAMGDTANNPAVGLPQLRVFDQKLG
jgi:hypothetical protein